MNNRSLALSLSALLVTGAAIGLAYAQTPPAKPPATPPTAPKQAEKDEGDEANEVTIQFADAPAAVKIAAIKLTPEKNIKKVSKETDEGVTIFEVEYTSSDGKSMSADLSEKGDVLSIDTDIKPEALTEAAAKAIKKAYPSGTIKGAEAVQEFYFEVRVMADGKPHEVKVTATGEIKGRHEQDEDKD